MERNLINDYNFYQFSILINHNIEYIYIFKASWAVESVLKAHMNMIFDVYRLGGP